MKLFARKVASRGAKPKGKKARVSLLVLALAVLAACVFGLVSFYGIWAQTFDLKKVGELPERHTVFDFDGKIYSRLAGANRLIVPLDEVSPFFQDAIVAREDTRFYQHGGLDPR